MARTGLLASPLIEQLKKAAHNEGFIEAGGVDLELAAPLFQEHIKKYDDWLSRGNAGEMQYLVRGRDRRADPTLVFPEAQSIFCALLPYRKQPAGQIEPSRGPRYARYLDGSDYHERVASKLENALRSVALTNPELNLRWKVCVDTSAVLERTWAALSGLGWIGKNTLLIHPQHGSYTFIGVALLNQKLDQSPRLLPDYCGNCTRCLSACPTQAIEDSHSVDSRKCISYWTLEKRGELDLSSSQKKAMGTWVAGCDLCQEVCPFNTKPVRAEKDDQHTNGHGAIAVNSWRQLWSEGPEDYLKRVKGSALSRVKPEMFRRNLKIALENAGVSAERDE